MKIITKNNFFSTVCIAFTIITLSFLIIEAILYGTFTPSQFNLLMSFVFSCLSVFVLSQHYRFESFSPLAVIILQYLIAILVVFGFVWISGFFIKIHPHGYRDIFVSFTIPYFIGTIVYYISLYLEVKKQNTDLQFIKSLQKNNTK